MEARTWAAWVGSPLPSKVCHLQVRQMAMYTRTLTMALVRLTCTTKTPISDGLRARSPINMTLVSGHHPSNKCRIFLPSDCTLAVVVWNAWCLWDYTLVLFCFSLQAFSCICSTPSKNIGARSCLTPGTAVRRGLFFWCLSKRAGTTASVI